MELTTIKFNEFYLGTIWHNLCADYDYQQSINTSSLETSRVHLSRILAEYNGCVKNTDGLPELKFASKQDILAFRLRWV